MSRRERHNPLESPRSQIIDASRCPIMDPAADNLLLYWIVRLRIPIFVLVAILQIAAFNGRWRIGRDGSLYRAVAHSLATGQGYTFRGERHTHAYPGLPWVLAGVEKLFGTEDILRPVISLSIMAALGGLTLVVIYHLIRLHFSLWIAVCVTTGVAINVEFLEASHDLMTDAPFLLGTSLTLLGISRLPRDRDWVHQSFSVLMAITGAIIAITTRPTFWALAIPFIVWCVIGLFRSRRRRWYAAAAVAVAAMVLVYLVRDPRTGGLHPLSGKYESMVFSRLSQLEFIRSAENVVNTCEEQIPVGLLGIELLFPLGTLLCITIVAWWARLMPRLPLWGLYVMTTIAMMVVLGSRPRYCLMILPMMLVAWALAVHWASLRVRRWAYIPELVTVLGLGMATLPNLVRSVGFIMEQHGIDRHFDRRGFLDVYRGGDMLPVYQMAQFIRQHVPPGKIVIGQEPRITSFISGRSVFGASEATRGAGPHEAKHFLRELGPDYVAYGRRVARDRPLDRLLHAKLLRIDWRTVVGDPEMFVVKVAVREDLRSPATGGTSTTLPSTRPGRVRTADRFLPPRP